MMMMSERAAICCSVFCVLYLLIDLITNSRSVKLDNDYFNFNYTHNLIHVYDFGVLLVTLFLYINSDVILLCV